MQIQINTDHHVEGHEALAAWVAGEVKSALSHFSDHIMRVEVQLTRNHPSFDPRNYGVSKLGELMRKQVYLEVIRDRASCLRSSV